MESDSTLSPDCIAARCAPLPRPFIDRLRGPLPRLPHMPLTDESIMVVRRTLADAFQRDQAELVQRIAKARPLVVTLLDPLVRNQELTMAAVRTLLNAILQHPPAESTVRSWVQRNLVRKRGWGRPDPHSIAAILIAALARPSSMRRALPPQVDPAEPFWWCWRQDAPDATVIPCPVPLPPDAPPGALLWTPWKGAAWDGWMELPDGAARWGSAAPGDAISHWRTGADPDAALHALALARLKH